MIRTLPFLLLLSCVFALSGSLLLHRNGHATIYLPVDVSAAKPTTAVFPSDRLHPSALGAGPTAATADAPPAPEEDPTDDILPMPETPPTQQFVPTSIKDFKIANPAEGISLIDAPTANSLGNASLTFNMIIPAGRQGIQPQLPIQYSSDNGASWLGTGWNLSAPAVTIDTRWGVPRYDPALETEMYQLNSQQLGPTNNRSALIARTAEKTVSPPGRRRLQQDHPSWQQPR